MWSDDEFSEDKEEVPISQFTFGIESKFGKSYEIVINQKFFMDLLYAHDIEKRNKKWTLYPYSDLDSIKSKNYVVAKDVTLMTQHSTYGILPELEIISKLIKIFPEIPFLFSLCSENMVIGGGSLATLINNPHYHRNIDDVDFFFHSLSIDEVIITIKKIVDTCVDKFGERMVVYQNRFVTTIIIVNDPGGSYKSRDVMTIGKKYQFIHRSFPNLSSVIGGFDLGASMVLLNSDMKIMTNLLGLITFATKIIFVDIKSASSSFGYRLFKYHTVKRFNLCFPRVPILDLKGKIQDAKNLFGLSHVHNLNIKIGENFYAGTDAVKGKKVQECMRIATNKTLINNDYDTVNPKQDVGISNMIALVNGNYESLVRCGRSWFDLENPPKIPPLKYLNNHLFFSKSKKVLMGFSPDFEKPSKRGDSILNLDLYNSLLNKLEQNQDQSKMNIIGSEDNPGRQFTASFHPTNPSEWYNEFVFSRENAPKIGIQWEIVRDISIARKRGHHLFGPMPRDLVKYLFDWIYISEGSVSRHKILAIVDNAKILPTIEYYRPHYVTE
tara:strand:+ start:19516 stop:21174 length:1659 start_codon:yes stop_codon:yes gene_type:complete